MADEGATDKPAVLPGLGVQGCTTGPGRCVNPGGRLHVACVAELALGREMAHAINAFKTAGGFVRLGHRVTVFCLPPVGRDIASALEMYGERGLTVHPIEASSGRTEDEASREFARRAVELAASLSCDCIYGRNFHVGLYGPERGMATVVETHAHVGDDRPLLDRVFAATRRRDRPLEAIVTIAPALREHYISRGADPARVHLVPDAADPELFAPASGWTRAAPAGRPCAVYSGHLYEYKGIPTILAAARRAADIDWVLLGGTLADVNRTREQASGLANVSVPGRVPHAKVPGHLWRADVLLLPPSAAHLSASWTSPLKLAEYLWTGRPIAASRIAGLENWVEEPAVKWFTPDSPEDLERCVRALMDESEEHRRERGAAQRAAAERFTYANRAREILATLANAKSAAADG